MDDKSSVADPRTAFLLGENIDELMARMEISVEDTMRVFGGAGNTRIFCTASGMNEASSGSAG
jgi:hypothetical protein